MKRILMIIWILFLYLSTHLQAENHDRKMQNDHEAVRIEEFVKNGASLIKQKGNKAFD